VEEETYIYNIESQQEGETCVRKKCESSISRRENRRGRRIRREAATMTMQKG